MDIIENRDAQFMLLAGFIIAIGLVITTVMLSSIIFEVNMALGVGVEPSKNDIINLMQITRDETRAAYRNVTEIGGTDPIRIANFNNTIQNFSKNLTKIYTLNGEGVNVNLDTGNWNNNRFANFTDSGSTSGASNWIVIENLNTATIRVNAKGPGAFKINVSNQTTSLLIDLSSNPSSNTTTITTITPPFSIRFINGANKWGNYSITGSTTNGRNFIRARDYIINGTVTFSTSRVRTNITIPISVPW
jgi:hypothetical protein